MRRFPSLDAFIPSGCSAWLLRRLAGELVDLALVHQQLAGPIQGDLHLATLPDPGPGPGRLSRQLHRRPSARGDGLTGLAEYRNGGLFLDCGIIVPRDETLLRQRLDPFSEAVVEWRALTVALLDRLAIGVCGGRWAAGREIAAERRPNGAAPLTIVSDGTLF